MSRFIDILHERYEGLILTAESLDSLLQLICERLDSTAVFLKVSLPFFIEKLAPSSNSPGLVSYHVDIVASCSKDTTYQVMAVSAPIMSACPSSIQLAQINSHNQRSFVRATINHCQHVFVEDVIAVIESSASASLYSSVKRVDELHLTRLAFTRPKFVEDVVRDVVVQLNILGMEWYSVDSCHVESIHNHQAYAKIIQPDIAIPIRELLAEL
jgi:GTP cyclohydrolase I